MQKARYILITVLVHALAGQIGFLYAKRGKDRQVLHSIFSAVIAYALAGQIGLLYAHSKRNQMTPQHSPSLT